MLAAQTGKSAAHTGQTWGRNMGKAAWKQKRDKQTDAAKFSVRLPQEEYE